MKKGAQGEGPALAWHADRPVGWCRAGWEAGQIPPESLGGMRYQRLSFRRLGLGSSSSQVPGKCPELSEERESVPCRFGPSFMILFLQEAP